MNSKGFWMRAAVLIVVMMSAAALLAKRGDREIIAPHQDLSGLPESIGTGWAGIPLTIDDRVREVLGPGDFMERSYHRSATEPPIDLFIAYFPSQRTGVSIHSPKNCLPGAGWSPLDATSVPLRAANGNTYDVNRYVVQKGNDRQLVLYWYQAHDRMIASEYAAKFYLVTDSIRMNRSDAALVRIITPMLENESAEHAQQRAVEFAEALVPHLGPFIPA
jgi:EpsI family protein